MNITNAEFLDDEDYKCSVQGGNKDSSVQGKPSNDRIRIMTNPL